MCNLRPLKSLRGIAPDIIKNRNKGLMCVFSLRYGTKPVLTLNVILLLPPGYRLSNSLKYRLLTRQLKIDELYAFNKSEFVGDHCRSTGLQSRLEAP